MAGSILFIVTSHDRLGVTGKATGLYLSEFAHPYAVFSAANYTIAVASPRGGDAPIDPKSIVPEFQSYIPFTKNTQRLATVDVDAFDALFVVGGHGTMWDLADDRDLQALLRTAYARGKLLAAVCHGPAAFTQLRDQDGDFLLRGRRVAGFSNAEEAAAQLSAIVPFSLEDALVATGARYEAAANWQPKVISDGGIVTGQNPASAAGVAQAILELLHAGVGERANVAPA